MSTQKRRSNQLGFTIVELMIATAVFSSVLLLCALAIVHVGRMYYKGTIISRTQDTSRKVGEDIALSVQFGSGGDPRAGTASYVYGVQNITVLSRCIGSVQYSYVTNRSVGSNVTYQLPHILWKSGISPTDTECMPVDITKIDPPGNGEELLGDKMRLPIFNLSKVSGNVWSLEFTVSYGDTADLFENANFTQCKGVSAGGQFCAVSEFNTIITKRLGS